eukprot:2319968-Alexandrium_andersonii.AAC.1
MAMVRMMAMMVVAMAMMAATRRKRTTTMVAVVRVRVLGWGGVGLSGVCGGVVIVCLCVCAWRCARSATKVFLHWRLATH